MTVKKLVLTITILLSLLLPGCASIMTWLNEDLNEEDPHWMHKLEMEYRAKRRSDL